MDLMSVQFEKSLITLQLGILIAQPWRVSPPVSKIMSMTKSEADLIVSLIAASAAGTAAVAAYVNAKFHIAHDLKNARGGLTPSKDVLEYMASRVQKKRVLVYHVFEDQALRNRPNHPFLIFEGRTWSYREFFDSIVHVGNWLMNEMGIEVEEVVAINGGNSPEYLMLWFALDAIGAVPSFINYNLTGPGLLHCAKVSLFEARQEQITDG
jgi:hypothetical protein